MYAINLQARLHIHSFNPYERYENMNMAAITLFQFLQNNLLTEYAYFLILYNLT